jgi:hypothetical protein
MGSGTPFRKRSLSQRAGPDHTLYLMPETYNVITFWSKWKEGSANFACTSTKFAARLTTWSVAHSGFLMPDILQPDVPPPHRGS